MIFRIYANKSNTISGNISSQSLNSGLNPVLSLKYGGMGTNNTITRSLLYFDLTPLQQRLNNVQINSNYVSGYTLNIKNASPDTKSGYITQIFENGQLAQEVPATSFDLLVAAISGTSWDRGRGYSIDNQITYLYTSEPAGGSLLMTGTSNWVSATTLNAWAYPGVYSNITGQTPAPYSIQHFDIGNEDIGMDITPIVNYWLTGNSNNGLIVAYNQPYEIMSGINVSVASFFGPLTNTAFLPYIQVTTNGQDVIKDDRPNVLTNKVSNLYLYLFSGHSPVNYFSAGTVSIQNMAGTNLITGLTPVQVSQGVYKISYWFSALTIGNYKDVWNGISINPPYDQETITQTFSVKPPQNLYSTPRVNAYALSIYGIEEGDILSNNNVLRVQCSLRANYSTDAPKTPYDLQYRIVMNNQLEVVPWTSVNQAYLNNQPNLYFNLDTSWFVTNQAYTIQFLINEMGTSRVLPEKTNFRVINNF